MERQKEKYLTAIRKVSEESGSPHIDFKEMSWTNGVSKGQILLDTVHPTALGHDFMAAHIHASLLQHGLLP
jgi:lysophospholipase L1-like esterase